MFFFLSPRHLYAVTKKKCLKHKTTYKSSYWRYNLIIVSQQQYILCVAHKVFSISEAHDYKSKPTKANELKNVEMQIVNSLETALELPFMRMCGCYLCLCCFFASLTLICVCLQIYLSIHLLIDDAVKIIFDFHPRQMSAHLIFDHSRQTSIFLYRFLLQSQTCTRLQTEIRMLVPII